MGNRLSKIYTRTGDGGSTGLGDGSRVDKDDLRVETYGTVDELNTLIGVLLSGDLPDAHYRVMLTDIQHDLFDLGGALCMPGHNPFQAEQVTRLENTLDTLNERLGPLKEFILPGGARAAALCHQACTVCRRAERRLVSLMKQQQVNPVILQYLNRLSDLLFVLARAINQSCGHGDVLWQPGKNRAP